MISVVLVPEILFIILIMLAVPTFVLLITAIVLIITDIVVKIFSKIMGNKLDNDEEIPYKIEKDD